MDINFEKNTTKQNEKNIFAESRRKEKIFRNTIAVLMGFFFVFSVISMILYIRNETIVRYSVYIFIGLLFLSILEIINTAFSFENDHIFVAVFRHYLCSNKISDTILPLIKEDRLDAMIFHKYMYESFYKFYYFKGLLLRKNIYVTINEDMIAGYLTELYRHYYDIDYKEFYKKYNVTRIELALLKYFFMNSFYEFLDSEEFNNLEGVKKTSMAIKEGHGKKILYIGKKYFNDIIELSMSELPKWFLDVKHMDCTSIPLCDKEYKRV